MLKKGYVRSLNQAFRRYLGHRAPAYVELQEITPKESIELIRHAGGIPVLAHPSYIGDDGIIPSIVGDGIQGIEVFYPVRDQTLLERYLALAKRYKLLITGGSNYHGGMHRQINVELGEITLPYNYYEELRKAFS
jgi:hypothetical protein